MTRRHQRADPAHGTPRAGPAHGTPRAGRAHGTPRAGPAHGTIVETTIERLGARGDGVASLYEGPLYVAFALPGERVRARIGAPRGEGWIGALDAVLTPVPGRVAAACRHFTRCGGCALQHLAPDAQADFKRAQVVAALRRR